MTPNAPIALVSFRDLAESGALLYGDGYRTKRDELGLEGFPILRVAQVGDGYVSDDFEERIRPEFRDKIGPKLSLPGDVVLTTKGTFGRRTIISPDKAGLAYSPQVCFFRVLDPKRVDGRYLYYWLGSADFMRQATGMKSQTDMADYLNLRDLGGITLSLPPIGQQRDIANALSVLDQRLDLSRRNSRTLESMARTVFRSWFVDFDPVRAKVEGRSTGLPEDIAGLFPNRLVKSAQGPVPEGWRFRPLDEVADFLNGLALQKYPPSGDGDIPVIKIAELRGGISDTSALANSSVPAEYIVNDGDVIFSWSGSLEVEVWSGGRGALNQHLFKVTSEVFPRWFYFLATKHHLPMFRAIAADKATTMGHINRGHLSRALVACPPESLLRVAGQLIESLLDHLVQNGSQIRAIVSLRDALLTRLLSGETLARGEALEVAE